MIPKGTFLRVVDNSGGKLAQVIGTYGHIGKWASVGDVVKVTIKDAKGDKVTKGTMKRAVVVEQSYPIRRNNGSTVQFSRNACVLLTDKGTPIGSRVKSLLPWEFVKPRWKRLSMLSGTLF